MADLWAPRRRIEAEFRRALLRIMRDIVRQVSGATTPSQMTAILQAMTSSRDYQRLCEAAAMKMVTGLYKGGWHDWREAARKNGKGRMLYEALQREMQGPTGARVRQLVAEVSYKIVTLPSDIGHDVTAYALQETVKGRRASDIAEEIQRMFPARTQANAKLIARTQVSMTQTDLTRARSEALGLDWYVWRSTGGMQGDGRTRPSHRKMAGVLVSWNDPPAPEDLFPMYRKDGTPYRNTLGHYHAGQCPNCRCYPEPVLDISQMEWPARVYAGGSIRTMNRRNFERMIAR